MGEGKLNFTGALKALKEGHKVKLPSWDGFWQWDYEKETVMMHCKDGRIIDIRDMENVEFTLENIASSDWEIATPDNTDIKVKEFVELDSDILQNDFTKVFHEKEFIHNAPHRYRIINANNLETLQSLKFQEGPIKEAGQNGIFMEDLIAICICNLEHFQRSAFGCRENAVAITHLETALMFLNKRKQNRVRRGVLGTNTK